MRLASRQYRYGVVALIVLGLSLWATGHPQQIGAAYLLWIAPVITWQSHLSGSLLKRTASAAGITFLAHTVATLLISYLPSAIQAWQLQLWAILLCLIPLLQTHKRKRWLARALNPVAMLPFLLVLLLTGSLRFWQLGYKEVQGDEGIALVRAASVLMGDETELLLHQKGPVEILLPLTQWGVTGQTNDLWARVPFALGSLWVVVAIYCVTAAYFDRRAALWAALLWGIVGFGVAFGRIVQYQSFVLLFGTLSLLQATLFARHGRYEHLLLSGLFLAGGLLSHYDAILVAPAVAWIVLHKAWRDKEIAWAKVAGCVAIAGVIVSLFYIPYVLNPHFRQTLSYLLNDRVGVDAVGQTMGAKFGRVWQMLTFYNSTYFIIGLVLLTVRSLFIQHNKRIELLLYAAVPILFYTIVVNDPRTHVYTMFPAICVLAGAAAVQQWDKRYWRPVLSVWVGLCTLYVGLWFVDVSAERQRNLSQPPIWLNPVTWASPPQFGLFGFPYQAGWRSVTPLIDPPFASNEEEEVTNWYTGHNARTHCTNFNTFILAENVQDEVAYDPTMLETLHHHHTVLVNGESKLRIYKRLPTTAVNVTEDKVAGWVSAESVIQHIPNDAILLDLTFGDRVKLIGYQIDNHNASVGGSITVILYWQALQAFESNYQSFVHLYDGTMWGQHDGAPECGINPTTRWEPGQIVPDTHVVPISADSPLNQAIPVLVGMYDLISFERLGEPIHLEDVYLTTP